jgi:hypothetical protein
MSALARPRGTGRYALAVALLLMGALTGVAAGARFALVPGSTPAPAAISTDALKVDEADGNELLLSAAGPVAEGFRESELLADAPALEGRDAYGVGSAAARGDGTAMAADDALIVRTGMLELEAEDVAAALREARREVGALGGYVAGSDVYDQGEQRWASVTYRVPVDRFEDAIDALRGLSDKVVRESTQSQEVTAQVVDLDARIDNLRASEEALVEIMDRAGRIDDVLSVQMRLEDVRRQIEQLTAQRDELSGRAALATLTATWLTPVAAVVVAQQGWDVATEVDAALAQTVAAFQGLASALVWVAVVGMPLLGLPLVLGGVVLVLLRRRMASRRPGGPSAPASLAGTAAE